MRPISLTLQAFGPFKDRVTIDFTKFNQSLFLVSGDTGSGKTSIFDGMVYALYGTSSGDQRGIEDIKSDFSTDEDFCKVEFEFEMNGQRYFIYRAPSQRTLGKRQRLVQFNGDVRLEYRDQIVDKVTEVKNEIEALLGMDEKQFRQIVILPQGEFQKLLFSDGAQKEQLFRELFKTHDIQALQEDLAQRTRQLKEQLTLVLENLKNSFHRVELTDDQKQLLEHQDYQQVLSQLEQRFQLLEKQYQKQQEQTKQDNQKLALIQQVNELLESGQQLEQQQAIHQEQAASIKAKRTQLEGHQKSKVAQNLVRQLIKLQKQAKEHHENLQSQQQQLQEHQKQEPVLLEQLKQAQIQYEQVPKLRVQEKQVREKIVHAENMDTQQRQLQDQQKALLTYQKEQKEIVQNLESLSKQMVQLEQEMANHQKTLLLEQPYQQRLREYESLKQNQQHRLQIYQDLTKLKQKIKDLLLRKETLLVAQKKALDRYQQHHQSFLHEQYAAISSELKTGQPCPVCGSLHHPQPAVFKDSSISSEMVDASKQAYDKSKSEYDQVLSFLQANQERFEQDLSQQKQDSLEQFEQWLQKSEDQLTTTKQELEKEKTAILTAKAEIERLEAENKVNLKNQQRLVNEQIKTTSQIEHIEKRIAEQKQAIEELKEKLDHQDIVSLKQQEQQIKTTIETIEQNYEQAVNNHQKHIHQLQNFENEVKTSQRLLSENEKTSAQVEKDLQQEKTTHQLPENILSLWLSDQDEQKLSLELKAYEHRSIELKTKINENQRQLQNIENYETYQRSAEEIVELKNKGEQQNQQLQQASVELTLLAQTIKENKGLLEKVQQQTKEFQQMNMLSEIAGGSKITDYVSFERFVLGVYFDEILEFANQRFYEMTNSRYQLQRRIDATKGRSKKGLDLDVFDFYTGKTRSVKSLSGGESFKAALSLALGLSDVMAQRSRARNISALFVDEGFGSLDNESLESALATLLSLHDEGKMIGIISHVDELKNRILNKIIVKKSSQGSTVEMVCSE